jgi:hypothetical protein
MNYSDDRLPYGWIMARVLFPSPVIYTFGLTTFEYFFSVREYERKHGLYESNRRRIITKCMALNFDPDQREPARITRENNLSISQDSLWKIAVWHAMTKHDHAFKSDELKLFFERHTNSLNDAEDFLAEMGKRWEASTATRTRLTLMRR